MKKKILWGALALVVLTVSLWAAAPTFLGGKAQVTTLHPTTNYILAIMGNSTSAVYRLINDSNLLHQMLALPEATNFTGTLGSNAAQNVAVWTNDTTQIRPKVGSSVVPVRIYDGAGSNVVRLNTNGQLRLGKFAELIFNPHADDAGIYDIHANSEGKKWVEWDVAIYQNDDGSGDYALGKFDFDIQNPGGYFGRIITKTRFGSTNIETYLMSDYTQGGAALNLVGANNTIVWQSDPDPSQPFMFYVLQGGVMRMVFTTNDWSAFFSSNVFVGGTISASNATASRLAAFDAGKRLTNSAYSDTDIAALQGGTNGLNGSKIDKLNGTGTNFSVGHFTGTTNWNFVSRGTNGQPTGFGIDTNGVTHLGTNTASDTMLSNAPGVFSIQTSNSASSKFYQTTTGVGVGQSAPANILHVTPPVGNTQNGYLRVDGTNGSQAINLGVYPTSQQFGAVYGGVNAPTANNYMLRGDGGNQTTVNGPGASTIITFAINDVTKNQVLSTGAFSAETNSIILKGTNSISAPNASLAFMGAQLWTDGTNLCIVFQNAAGTRTTNKVSLTAWP